MFWILPMKKILPVTSNRYVCTHLLLPGPRHTASSGVTEFISSDTFPFNWSLSPRGPFPVWKSFSYFWWMQNPSKSAQQTCLSTICPGPRAVASTVQSPAGFHGRSAQIKQNLLPAIHCWHRSSSRRPSSSMSCLPWRRRAGSTVPGLPCTFHGILQTYWAGRDRTVRAKPCTSSLSLSSPNH